MRNNHIQNHMHIFSLFVNLLKAEQMNVVYLQPIKNN